MAAFERCDVATWTHVKGGFGQEAPVGLNRVKVGNVRTADLSVMRSEWLLTALLVEMCLVQQLGYFPLS